MKDKRIILIGEVHGTKEIPVKIKELCQSIQENIIFLEVSFITNTPYKC